MSSLIVKGLPTQDASELQRGFFLLIFLSNWIHPVQIHLSVAFIAETETPDKGRVEAHSNHQNCSVIPREKSYTIVPGTNWENVHFYPLQKFFFLSSELFFCDGYDGAPLSFKGEATQGEPPRAINEENVVCHSQN
jgi:hypothetical protein